MDELVMGNGSNELIDMIARTFTSPDSHAVFGHPSFVCYWLACTAANVPFTMVPLRDHLAWDIDAMLDAVRPETRLLYLANPNNPTGAHVGRRELERLLRELPESVMAVIDEAYFEFPDADDYASAMEMRDLRERLIVLRTFSKAYGMATHRVGYAITTPTAADYLNRVRAPFNVGAVNQAAARAALTDPEHVERYLDMNRRERARVSEVLTSLGLQVAPSQANFLLVDFGRPGKEVYEELLREAVIVRPMPAPIETWLRITIGTPEQNSRLFEAVKAVLGR
jgi:histidinol-phosphate aminotransferase